MSADLAKEALSLLRDEGGILELAREVTRLMVEAGLDGAVVGGVAVFLHGYRRTTADVDVYVGDASRFAEIMVTHGYVFEPVRREFDCAGIPVHVVLEEQLGRPPHEVLELDGVRTVSLADLINFKLRSGMKKVTRAIDLADVIGLIRSHNLRSTFAAKLDKDLRPEFRKLVQAVESESQGS